MQPTFIGVIIQLLSTRYHWHPSSCLLWPESKYEGCTHTCATGSYGLDEIHCHGICCYYAINTVIWPTPHFQELWTHNKCTGICHVKVWRFMDVCVCVCGGWVHAVCSSLWPKHSSNTSHVCKFHMFQQSTVSLLLKREFLGFSHYLSQYGGG